MSEGSGRRGGWRSSALAAALAAVTVVLGANTVYRAGYGSKLRTDLPVYLAGAERVLEGEDPLGARSPTRGWPYVYPPTLAVGMVVLRPLPLPLAAALWYLVSAAALGLGVWAVRRALGREGPLRWVDDGLPLALVAIPCASALVRGQVGPLLLGLLGVAALCLARGRDGAAGLLISLAAAIKVTPALVIVGLLVARRWRALASCLGGLTLWLLVVPAPFLGPAGTARALGHYSARIFGAYVGDPGSFTPDPEVDPGDYPVHISTNQSVASQVVRRTSGVLTGVALGLLVFAVVGASLAVSAGLLRPDQGAPRTLAACAVLLAAPLIAAPIAWHHHHVLLYPALALAVVWRRQRRWAAPVLGVFALLSLLHFVVLSARWFGLLGWGTLLVYAGVTCEAWAAARGRSQVLAPP